MADAKGDDRKDVDFTAPWVEDLRHRANPNRVEDLQLPPANPLANRPPAGSDLPAATASTAAADHRPAVTGAARQHDAPSAPQPEPSYYDVSMLKQPLWKWEIASYFFLGGLSAGAYILSRVADWHGGRHKPHDDMTRIGTYLALATFLPCPPLLIHDLGDPKRFHHMLRVWKPSTPMNLGTWSIVGYSGMAAAAVLREYMKDKVWPGGEPPTALLRAADKALLVVHDAAGVPFAMLVAGYTGVLLSCTSNPLWCKNPWLGPLFMSSAMATGAEAISLALDCTTDDGRPESQSVLRKVDTAAHAAELACLGGFSKFAGEKAKPLHTGSQRKHHLMSIGGIIGAEVLKALPVNGPLRRPVRMAAAALGLAAGFSLRWAMVMGGHEAAADPHLARAVSRPGNAAGGALGGVGGAGGRGGHGRVDRNRGGAGRFPRH